MKPRSWVFLSLGVVLLWAIVPVEGASFKVVVNSSNPDFATTDSVEKSRLSLLFLKKALKWNQGALVVAVDQSASTPIREDFCREVHGKSLAAIQSYWQRQIFSGRSIPPPEKPSDREVLDFVRSNRYAIGYVSDNARVGEGLKVLEIREQ